ncbi:hypothetical protein HJG54_34415 [Leptolyngbya sp. NK1-12]|uniref:DUF2281 domain-containing protein n=1 Tax=Leptolyngbya sp. NK1-12 TaxID=2547451 RepID=A0AA97AJK9_9CYAN|nr:hypothetical protein [Leptolyngbya sp. NK1-12]WNZ26873.1 hypothetical protein HJG54_28500 [Leptolyngbya sp. NK1-12]WNZ27915.1 hypothetical protein HJG54_34415 [Leptolyngbya sp. NK1-12]
MEPSIIQTIVQQLEGLPQPSQQQVLEFVRSLAHSQLQGISGAQLLQFAGTIPSDDLQLMREAIEQDCEQVDWNEW